MSVALLGKRYIFKAKEMQILTMMIKYPKKLTQPRKRVISRPYIS